jgi:hypothetical protein
MRWPLPIAIVFCSLTGGVTADSQTRFTCTPVFEARQLNKPLEPTLRAAIVDIVRKYAREQRLFWQKLAPPELGCMDLTCLSDEEIVTQVVLSCSANPFQKLESAAINVSPQDERVLETIIRTRIGR